MREAEKAAEFCREMRALGLRYAACRRLRPEDQEDCAMDFVARMLARWQAAQEARDAAALPPITDAGWQQRQAHTHARNFHRREALRAVRCVSLNSLS